MPSHFRVATLWLWQLAVIATFSIPNSRRINLLYCPNGNIGKTTLVGYARAKGLAKTIPFCNDYQELMAMVMSLITDVKNPPALLVDMPRALRKDKMAAFWAGLETIKDGYAFDKRYNFKEKIFNSPVIWVFTNTLPNKSYLSLDRWVVWHVVDKQLVPFNF